MTVLKLRPKMCIVPKHGKRSLGPKPPKIRSVSLVCFQRVLYDCGDINLTQDMFKKCFGPKTQRWEIAPQPLENLKILDVFI